MQVKINNHDITPYIAFQGIQRTRRDVYEEMSTMDGVTHRTLIATKTDLSFTFQTLDATSLGTIMGYFSGTNISVTFDDPILGTRTATMMPDDYSNGLLVVNGSTSFWQGATVSLKEC